MNTASHETPIRNTLSPLCTGAHVLIVWYKWRDFFSTLEYNHNLVTVYCICMARNIKLAFCYFFLFVDRYVYVYSIDALKTSKAAETKSLINIEEKKKQESFYVNVSNDSYLHALSEKFIIFFVIFVIFCSLSKLKLAQNTFQHTDFMRIRTE